MSVVQLTPADLCRRLAEGWKAESAEAPRELLDRLSARWQANVELQESAGPSAYRAALELNRLRLLGALDFGCLVLGPGANVEREVAAFWQQQGGIGRLALILAATPAVKEAAQRAAHSAPCLFLADGEIEALLTEPHPLEVLKHHLRKQIPIRRLVPYDFMHPAPPNMFFGRRDLLERLHTEVTTSFAIAGPGRIGKSSLLRQYRYELRRNFRDDRRHRLVSIDCYPCGALSADAFACRIALDIAADSAANRVNCATLLRFLKYRSRDGEKPIELLLDEVDTVCLNPAFQELGEAARQGYCRVILCGRSNLHRMMRKNEAPFARRLELIQPEPLDMESAGKLLLDPLRDLGFKLQDIQRLQDSVFELTSRRPDLIQACAKQMVDIALAEKGNTITIRHLQLVRERFGAMAFGTLPLDDLQDDLTRLIALLLLRSGADHLPPEYRARMTAPPESSNASPESLWRRFSRFFTRSQPSRISGGTGHLQRPSASPAQPFGVSLTLFKPQAVNLGSLQKLAAQHGIGLDATKSLDICYDLWMCGLLNWERNGFALANPQLIRFVQRMDFRAEVRRLSSSVAKTASSLPACHPR